MRRAVWRLLLLGLQFVELSDSIGGFRYGCRIFEILACGCIVALESFADTSYIFSLFGSTGFFEEAVGLVEITAFERADSSVEIGRRIGGIHADSGLEDVVELLAAGLAVLCYEIELVEAEFLRVFLHDAADFVDVAV